VVKDRVEECLGLAGPVPVVTSVGSGRRLSAEIRAAQPSERRRLVTVGREAMSQPRMTAIRRPRRGTAAATVGRTLEDAMLAVAKEFGEASWASDRRARTSSSVVEQTVVDLLGLAEGSSSLMGRQPSLELGVRGAHVGFSVEERNGSS